jgi:hypothetical protein
LRKKGIDMKKIVVPMVMLFVMATLYIVWFSTQRNSLKSNELATNEESIEFLDEEELLLIDIDRVLTADNRMEFVEEYELTIEEEKGR